MQFDTPSGAILSSCGQYRYLLWRTWDKDKPRLLVVMLNPSTADAYTDDPTVRKIMKFAQAWGFGGVDIVNLFAYRATDPDELSGVPHPIGPLNDTYINDALHDQQVTKCLCAWGRRGSLLNRDKAVMALIANSGVAAYVLKYNEDGSPAHPLYQRDDAVLLDVLL